MGKLIIYPTDTLYGIGCGIFDLENIRRIYDIKHRSFDKPLACLCADLDQIKQIAVTDEPALKLIRSLMPGALTLILKTQKEVEEKIGYKTIGVRIPDCSTARELLLKNGPMLTTSVNDSGSLPMNQYEDILKRYRDLVDEIYPPEPSSAVASTGGLLKDGTAEILREGTIKKETIIELLNA